MLMMRRFILSALLFLLPTVAVPDCRKQRPALGPLRSEEDWSLLADADCRRESFDGVKYISLRRKDWFLSLGGEIRYRYENYESPGFGADIETGSGYILERYLLHSDWHWDSASGFSRSFKAALRKVATEGRG